MSKNHFSIIKKIFGLLVSDPVFFVKRIFLELKYRILPAPKTGVIKPINGVLFNFDFAYSKEVKRMYYGSYQPVVNKILKRYLRPGDAFIDAGASIGYFSMLAAGYVGKEGQVHSFEPVPEYFFRLQDLVDRNRGYKIFANKFALGDKEKTEKIFIEGRSGIGNNTFFPIFLENIGDKTFLGVPVKRLDDYIEERAVRNIKLIKIDVEGFEFPVLKGLENYFKECKKTEEFPLIICEICPEAYTLQGYKLEDLFSYMEKFSYYPFDILNTRKQIRIGDMKNGQMSDVLFKHIIK